MLSGFASAIGEGVKTALAGRVIWSPQLGMGRTLLALSTFGTILATSPRYLLREPTFFGNGGLCSGPARASVFCVFGDGGYGTGRVVALLILLAVASGWRPRLTGLGHWWVSFSLQVTSVLADGGDAVAAILTLLLLPVVLTDRRRWHWSPAPAAKRDEIGGRELVAASGLVVVQLQVAVVYLYSAIAKFGVPAWTNGTAAYYWLLNPRLGVPEALRNMTEPVLTNGLGVVLVTYEVILIELALGVAWTVRGRARRVLFAAGATFHVATMFLMGIQSFGISMVGALVLYLLASDGPVLLPGRVRNGPTRGKRGSPVTTRSR